MLVQSQHCQSNTANAGPEIPPIVIPQWKGELEEEINTHKYFSQEGQWRVANHTGWSHYLLNAVTDLWSLPIVVSPSLVSLSQGWGNSWEADWPWCECCALKRDGAACFWGSFPIISAQWGGRWWRGLGEHRLPFPSIKLGWGLHPDATWCWGLRAHWDAVSTPSQSMYMKPLAPTFHSMDHLYRGVRSARSGQDFIPYKEIRTEYPGIQCYLCLCFSPASLMKHQALSSPKALLILWFSCFWSAAAGQTLEWGWLTRSWSLQNQFCSPAPHPGQKWFPGILVCFLGPMEDFKWEKMKKKKLLRSSFCIASYRKTPIEKSVYFPIFPFRFLCPHSY